MGTSLLAALWPWLRRRAAAAAQAERAQAVAREKEMHAGRMRLMLRLDHEPKNPLQALRLTVVSATGPAHSTDPRVLPAISLEPPDGSRRARRPPGSR